MFEGEFEVVYGGGIWKRRVWSGWICLYVSLVLYLIFVIDCVVGMCEFSDVCVVWVCEVMMKLFEVFVEKWMLYMFKSWWYVCDGKFVVLCVLLIVLVVVWRVSLGFWVFKLGFVIEFCWNVYIVYCCVVLWLENWVLVWVNCNNL